MKGKEKTYSVFMYKINTNIQKTRQEINNMKKFTLIITLAALLCFFTSCSVKNSDDKNANHVAVAATKAVSEKTEGIADAPKENDEETFTGNEVVTASLQDSTNGTNVSTLQDNTQYENDPVAGTAFKRGVVNGNVYTSEYAGFKFTAPQDAIFYDEEQIKRANTTPLEYMSEEEKIFFKTGFLDASVRYSDFGGYVSIWYYNTKLRYPDTPDISAEEFIQKEFFESDYQIRPKDMVGPEKVTVGGNEYMRFSYTSLEHPYCMYVRRIDDDFIVKIDASEDTIDDIERRITMFN